MNLTAILAEYDAMFGKVPLSEIEEFLYEKICEAVAEHDSGAIITLLNEMVGLCRDTSQKEKALAYCEQLKKMLDKMQLHGTDAYATSMLNIANDYRAFGLWEEAAEAFALVEKCYQGNPDKNDFRMAGLYNNWGLLYQEQEEYEQSVCVLLKALEFIDTVSEATIGQAITRTNLANSLFQTGSDENRLKGYKYLNEAIDTFVKDGEKDFHYGAALVSMGDFCAQNKEWKKAKRYYQKGLVEILKHTGKNDNYFRVLEKLRAMEEKIKGTTDWKSNLQLSREFYQEYGVKMIQEKFPEFENRIAAGLVGEGSDCFRFDDEISTDHDYEIGFCMWITKEDYDKIGKELQHAYKNLIKEHVVKNSNNGFLENRRGVFLIDEFYQSTDEESKLAEMINGEVFRDDLGIFTEKRNQLLNYYPERIWRNKLANLLHEFSQYGQSNYSRMMAREDYLTASLCISKAMESAMDIAYVLQRKYAPYYKWKRKGLEVDKFMPELLWIGQELAELPCQSKAWEGVKYDATKINHNDKCVALLELMAKVILEKLKEQHLVTGDDPFLELYVGQILEGEKIDR